MPKTPVKDEIERLTQLIATTDIPKVKFAAGIALGTLEY